VKRRIFVRPQALTDLSNQYLWYETQKPGLGDEFLDAADRTFRDLETSAEIYRAVLPQIRRVLLRRFPFAVFFIIDESDVYVLAVLHGRRDPARWPHGP
jgi:toxin ParE1/3/4